MMTPTKRNTVLYRLSPEVKRKFRIIAANADSTMAVITRNLMTEWINNQPVTVDNPYPAGWKPEPIDTRAWAISHADEEEEWQQRMDDEEGQS